MAIRQLIQQLVTTILIGIIATHLLNYCQLNIIRHIVTKMVITSFVLSKDYNFATINCCLPYYLQLTVETVR